MNIILTFFFVFEFILTLFAPLIDNSFIRYGAQEYNGIELIISNIRNKGGLIRIGVFNSEDGYPDKPVISYSLAKDTISSGDLKINIPVRSAGDLAISILDDENRNCRMDYRFGIMPREGFGFSNNPQVTSRKPPPFSEASFKYAGGKTQIRIRMVYI